MLHIRTTVIVNFELKHASHSYTIYFNVTVIRSHAYFLSTLSFSQIVHFQKKQYA